MDINRCFEILEISPEATYEEAKASYRLLVQVWHPDKHSNNEKIYKKATNKLKEINVAWSVVDTDFKNIAKKEAGRKRQEQTTIVKCTYCNSGNRLPEGGYFDAKCGNCGKYLHPSKQEHSKNYGTCTDCGKALENDGGFCSKCGVIQINTKPLDNGKCTDCGEILENNSDFCTTCGVIQL